jgi:D-alanyl-lipoteichoic acid acyltransferase DltB (MBOAT superfamily)
VEVYRRKQKAEKNLVTYATYVMFFPQLVAGPIERPQNLLHQFYERHAFDADRITSGLKRMAWGFFKKLVVADRLALYVNDVYGSPHEYNGLQLMLGTVFFAYQIYCDFSGYSDIAIGAARVLGFRLMENFDTPYYAQSISEFWHRWHISLSTWFRDYVYIPLGGSRVPALAWCGNILVTFALSGLWHGANWTYVVWGLVNGGYLLVGAGTARVRGRFWSAFGVSNGGPFRILIRVAGTFFLVCVGWIIFRSRSLGDAGYILGHCFRNWDLRSLATEHCMLRQVAIGCFAVLFLESVQMMNAKVRISELIKGIPLIPRWATYLTFVFTVIMFGVFRNTQFIYFQF